MMSSWWILWVFFMFIFLVPSVGYGWGYRSWGPPYPSYIQRRRGAQAAREDRGSTFNHRAWGLGGDFVWFVILIGIVWACAGIWWR